MSFIVEVQRQDQVPVPELPSGPVTCGECGAACWLSESTGEYLGHLVVADDVEVLCAGCTAAQNGGGGVSLSVAKARDRVVRAALRVLSSQLDEEHAHAGDEAEYANEQLALAARDLAEATEALPAGERPVGWSRKDGAQ